MDVGQEVIVPSSKRKDKHGEVWATCGSDQTCIVRFRNHSSLTGNEETTKWIPWSNVEEIITKEPVHACDQEETIINKTSAAG